MKVIEFKELNKAFKIYKNKSYSVKEIFINKTLRRNKLEVQEFKVLNNVNFQINKGETIGIIGENGTGKSTSLKLLSKILYPDSGEVYIQGKVSSLIEIGAGFQPDLSGRENVYLYGSILGLSKEEIAEKYESIVKFSEVEEFMDTAVKNYSSGMYMRLAFSVAINVNPDILLIDEVLAVGDENFQKKCINKILEFKKAGKTIVFVSHDMSTVKRICDRVFFIRKGGEVLQGTTDEMIGLYLKYCYSRGENHQSNQNIKPKDIIKVGDIHKAYDNEEVNRWGDRRLEITNVYFSALDNQIRNVFKTGEDIRINVEFKKNDIHMKRAVIGLAIYSENGWHLCGPNCQQDGQIIESIQDSNLINVVIKQNPFLKGKYKLTVALYDDKCIQAVDHREKHYVFNIVPQEIDEYGVIKLNCIWNV